MTQPASQLASPPPSTFVVAVTYVRGVVGDGLLVLWTIVLSLVILAVSAVGWKGVADATILLWGRVVLWLFGVTVHLRGIENFPLGKGSLVLFNHQSLFDIPVLYGTFRRRMRFGSKSELFKIPLFGPAMRSVGTLEIVRNDRAATLRIYRKAESMFAQGFSFALAPEGTRQDEPRIGRFKAGPFLFAIGAQASIVPAVIKGAHEVLPKKRLVPNVGRWKSVVELTLLPAISTAGMTESDVGSLIDRVRNAMVTSFNGESSEPATVTRQS